MKFTHIRSFSFRNTYFVINEEKSQISYITMYGRSHHQNDTQSLCKSLFLFCFFCFCFVFVFFSILAIFYINFETGKLPAHERNNFIFHVNMYFCNIVFTVIVSLMQILSIVDPAYHILQTFCNFVVK